MIPELAMVCDFSRPLTSPCTELSLCGGGGMRWCSGSPQCQPAVRFHVCSLLHVNCRAAWDVLCGVGLVLPGTQGTCPACPSRGPPRRLPAVAWLCGLGSSQRGWKHRQFRARLSVTPTTPSPSAAEVDWLRPWFGTCLCPFARDHKPS